MNARVNKNKQATRKQDEVAPTRKIGRYILLVMVLVPLLTQLHRFDLPLPTFDLSGPLTAIKSLPVFAQEKVKNKVDISEIKINGKLDLLDKRAVMTTVTDNLHQNFVLADIRNIQSHIENMPWVYSASVERLWPNTLDVHIVEQQAIAKWRNEGFVNLYGEIIKTDGLERLNHLPTLIGPEENAATIASQYATFAKSLHDYGLYISELRVSENDEWKMQINHEFDINLGRHDLSARLDRFLYIYSQQLKPVSRALVEVDVRYKKGLAVRWRQNALVESVASKNEQVGG